MPEIDIGIESYQSVVGLDEADVYLSADVRYANIWVPLEDDDKGRKLVTVTRIFQRQPWKVPLDFAAVPQAVREAACEFAGALAAGYDLGVDQAAAQVARRKKAGSVEVEYFRNFDAPDYTPPPMPKEAWLLILPFLQSDGAGMSPGAIATGVDGCDYTLVGNGWYGFGQRDYL